MRLQSSLLLISLAVASLFAKTTVNENIYVAADERVSGCTSVNGNIFVGEGAHINGDCRSVNGSINVERNCITNDLKSVNGRIEVGEKTSVRGDLGSINGPIQCAAGVYVRGSIETVNGFIELEATEVKNGVSTFNGDILLLDGAVVRKNIIVKDNNGQSTREKPLYITIDNSVVEGDILNREKDIEVIVVLRNGGRVNGKVIGADVQE